jgi:acid phosphatase
VPATEVATAAAPPCTAGTSILNAVLWVETSAEYRAAALQTFGAARRALDQALTDRSWIGAEEETSSDDQQPPAIILDLDETVLDNSGAETRFVRAGITYDVKMWKQWVSESAAVAVPGAAEFLAYANSRGVTAFYVTNREADEEAATRRNLELLGFPMAPDGSTLLVRGKNGFTTADKSARRAFVAGSHRVLLLLGDDLNDFVNANGKTAAEREQILGRTASWWGTHWFILPNPMYGSFEAAAIGSGGTPCEKLQRKVEALRTR